MHWEEHAHTVSESVELVVMTIWRWQAVNAEVERDHTCGRWLVRTSAQGGRPPSAAPEVISKRESMPEGQEWDLWSRDRLLRWR